MNLSYEERHISQHDASRIASLIDARAVTHPSERDDLDELADVVAGARRLPAADMPADVAALGRRVHILLRRGDDTTASSVTVVEPHEAVPASGRISVVSPLGRTLLGLRIGMRDRVALPDGAEADVEVQAVEGEDTPPRASDKTRW